MTRLDIASRRLRNQRLTAAALKTPTDVVSWLGAVQAQDYAAAKWALGLRMQRATDAGVERALSEGTVLRTHLLRPTWHFVAPADIRWMLALTAPRVQAANAYMYRKLELDSSVFKRSTTTLAKALQGGQQLTRDELRGVFHKAGLEAGGEFRMGYIMMHAELEGIVCSGARRGKQFTYALLAERAPQTKIPQREEALVELARRYFMSRGPATVRDFAKWSGLTITDARTGLEAVSSQLQHEVMGSHTYWFPASKTSAKQNTPTAHLLSVYDEYISGYRDHSAVVDKRHDAKLVALGNALSYVIVVDGQIVGAWKRTLRKAEVVIRIDTFRRLTRAEQRAVAAAAHRYGEFLGLPIVLPEIGDGD